MHTITIFKSNGIKVRVDKTKFEVHCEQDCGAGTLTHCAAPLRLSSIVGRTTLVALRSSYYACNHSVLASLLRFTPLTQPLLLSLYSSPQAYCGQAANSAAIQLGTNASGTILWDTVDSTPLVGNGCQEMSSCNLHGTCDYCYNTCTCDMGFGNPATEVYEYGSVRIDCAERTCPKGKSLRDLPVDGDRAHADSGEKTGRNKVEKAARGMDWTTANATNPDPTNDNFNSPTHTSHTHISHTHTLRKSLFARHSQSAPTTASATGPSATARASTVGRASRATG
jgi:hypothetical protein